MPDELVKILRESGYTVIEGTDAVLGAIQDQAGTDSTPLCSGFGVFPDGAKCPGCKDCQDDGGHE